MPTSKQILIAATWDPDAKVWVAESEDVPGLVAEADSPESLLEKLKTRIPELLELNDSLFKEYSSLDLRVQYQREDRATLPAAA
jgi:predicted RNase H-like HicB family nuclease